MTTLSIVIPAKNEEKNIGQVLTQLSHIINKKNNIEIIVVDNGSTDKTLEIASGFNVQIHTLPDVTVASVRNYGAKIAKGDCIAFLDADCIVDRDWLKSMKKYFLDPEVGAFGSTPIAPENGTWVERNWSLVRARRQTASEVDWINSSNLIVKRSAFHEISGFSEDLITCEDVDFCYRLISNKYKIIYDPKIKAIHLGEPKTIKEFIKKEIWRGKNNYSGISFGTFKLTEAKSLLIPFYLPMVLLSLILCLIGKIFLFAFFPIFFVPILCFNFWVLKYCKLEGRLTDLGCINILFLAYATGRSIALANKILKIRTLEEKK